MTNLSGGLIERLAADSRIEAVWLFGSRARNQADALSDVDIAVLVRDDLSGSALWDADLAWSRVALAALGTDEVVGKLR